MKNIVKESFNASNVSFANKLRLEDGKKKLLKMILKYLMEFQ